MDNLDLDNLVDPKNLVQRQKAADKIMQGYSQDEWRALRQRAKADPFFLCYGVLGYTKLSKNLHGSLSQWMTSTDNDQFREILLPRAHYKSTIATVGDGIRIALPDDTGVQPWPRNLGVDGRIVIAHEVHDMAARFVGSITSHFMSNPTLMALFPECVPIPRKQRINAHELELPRSEIWNEPTFDSMGVGARSQGRHYNFMKLDDLFGVEAMNSVTIRQTVYDWFDNIQAFFSAFAVDHFDLIGTRYAHDDLYSHAHAQYGALLKRYIRGVEETGEDGIRRTIFPEEFPIEKLAILKRNPKIFNSQYANDPSEGGSEFPEDWLMYYTWAGQNTIAVGDKKISLSECDIVIFYDPAIQGYGGYLVTATDKNDNTYTLIARKDIWSPPEFVKQLFLDVQRWSPRIVVIESVLFSDLYQHWLIREQSMRDVRFRIEPAKTRQKSKESRIRGLSNFFSARKIFFHTDQHDLIQEFRTFGASKNIHILDALAYGPEYWRRGRAIERAGEIASDMIAKSNRNLITGYSK